MNWKSTRVHIIGIGGAGMSGLARLLTGAGATVTGCDARDSDVVSTLRSEGIAVSVGSETSHLDGCDLVLFSPAVPANHPERRDAARREIPSPSRQDMFATLTAQREVIAIAGTHGKTTATSMMACVSHAAGRSYGRLLGEDVSGVGRNGEWGHDRLVLELDESFGTFLSSTPTLLGVLNVEADHLDFYDTEENVLAAFTQVARQTTGAVVVWADDFGAAAVGRAVSGITVGTDPQHDAVVRDLTSGPQGASCQLSYRSQSVHISLRVPGRHNIANAAVVAVLALEDGFEVGAIEQGLSNFAGAPRRFTRRGTWRGMPVIEDYAHLPREITATLAAIYDIGARSPVVVYQPHRFSRTRDQLATIGSAFVGECTVIVTDIYGAGESDPGTVSGADVADRLPASAHAHYVGALADVPGVLNTLDGDALVLMGAGDVASVLSMLDVTP